MFVLDEKNEKIYTILSTKNITERNLEIVELSHNVTKAKILLFICDDENRVFNIVFKTPVSNGKGIPHILEHSVLCGSRKYDVKDPFIELAKSSLNTFLNAMTFPDKTCYPVASANLKDFHNLVDVYLDAVFYPNACKNEKIFKQEGWHYEIEDKNSPLTVNGVVYNEMKGVYSDPNSILENAIMTTLYKNTNYAYESGGDPKEIINLTYDEFIEFHKKFYSPSNSIVYFYGKLDFNYELSYLNDEYFSNFNYLKCDLEFLENSDFVEDEEKVSYYNVDNEDIKDKAYISYTFSLDDKKSTIEHIILLIIDYVIFTSEGAVLKEKLMNMGFGESVFSNYDQGIKHGQYSIVAQNIDANKKASFIKEIKDAINDIINNGLDIEKVQAAINYIYFDLTEDECKSYPRGIVFSIYSLYTYLYGEGYDVFLEFKEAMEYIKNIDLYDKNNIFIKTIKKYFVDNKHKCINVLIPKKGLSKENDDILAKELLKRKERLSTSDIDNIIKDLKELKEYQASGDSEEKLKCIPKLKVSDIERDKLLINYSNEKYDGEDAIISFDNEKEIAYLDLSFDVTDFSKEEKFFLSVINILFAKMDFKDMTYSKFNNYVDINTGGLDIGIRCFEKKALFSFSVKTLIDNISIAYNIFLKLIKDVLFVDVKRIILLLNERKSDSLISLLSSAHLAAINRSKSNNSFASSMFDIVDDAGVASYQFIECLCKIYADNSDTINNILTLLYKKIISNKILLGVCIKKDFKKNVDDEIISFINTLHNYKNENAFSLSDNEKLFKYIDDIKKVINFNDFEMKDDSEAIITPNDVNFCALSGVFDEKKYSGVLSLLKIMFNYEYLWTNVRMIGGAYGCFSDFTRTGNYSFASYRDPNLTKTNDVFLGVKDFLLKYDKSDEEIEKYIIGTMGMYDNPISIISRFKRNFAAYMNNVTNEMLNKHRHEILDTKVSDIKKISDLFDCIEKKSNRCAIISEKSEEEAKSSYKSVWRLVK